MLTFLFCNFQLTHEMAQAAGIETEFDAELFHSLRNNRGKYIIICFQKCLGQLNSQANSFLKYVTLRLIRLKCIQFNRTLSLVK